MVLERHLYNVLNVAPNATLNQIKASYNRLSLRFHPDRNPSGAEEFIIVKYAYDTLKDPQIRQIYDDRGEAGVREHKRKELTDATREDDMDVVESSPDMDMQVITFTTDVSLKELYRGALNKQIHITRLCRLNDGNSHFCNLCRGMQMSVETDVDITQYVNNNGEEIQCHLAEDLYKPVLFILKLIETPHEIFKRDGANLITKVALDFIESITYFERAIQTLDHKVLHVKKMCGSTTRDKEKITFEGWGLPYYDNGQKMFGDLIVFCRVMAPPKGFYEKMPIRFLLRILPSSPPTPNFGNIKETKIKFLYQSKNDGYEDSLDRSTPDAIEYNRTFNHHHIIA